LIPGSDKAAHPGERPFASTSRLGGNVEFASMKVRAAGLCNERLRIMDDERIAQLRRAAEHERSAQ
jgi:hypothetical protein